MNKYIKILYVEDDKQIRNELFKTLEFDFDEVLTAVNGEEGLKLFKGNQPDLVISDIQMPKMDGISICKEIQKIINKDTEFILTTAFNETNFRDKAQSLGTENHITKPINIKKLYTHIENCCKQIKGK